MAKKFAELRAKMDPERVRRSDAAVKQLLATMPTDEVEGVTPAYWALVQQYLLDHRGQTLPVDQLATTLSLPRVTALAIVIALGEQRLVEPRYAVYHNCSESPVSDRAMTNGFQPVPWTCPGCGQTVKGQDGLRYDVVCFVPQPESENQHVECQDKLEPR